MKSLGLVKGVLDFEFYYAGTLYVFDFKVGKDKLSKEQKEYIKAIEKQEGQGFEIRSLEEFKARIMWIIDPVVECIDCERKTKITTTLSSIKIIGNLMVDVCNKCDGLLKPVKNDKCEYAIEFEGEYGKLLKDHLKTK